MRVTDLFRLDETLADWPAGPWLHYSTHPMLSLNPQIHHNDPLGLYFFPPGHRPVASMWHEMPYRYEVTLKPDARILDFGAMTEAQLDRLIDATDSRALYDDYLARFPTDDPHKRARMAWEMMRNRGLAHMAETGHHGAARWTRAIRAAGWDAIFDDTGAIHSVEPQLLVVNPRIIASVHRERRRNTSGFAGMRRVLADLDALCRPYGAVEIEPARMKVNLWDRRKRTLQAALRVSRANTYAQFRLDYDPAASNGRSMIRVRLSDSEPRLNYGVGLTYNFASEQYDSTGMAGLGRDLDHIFGEQLTPDK